MSGACMKHFFIIVLTGAPVDARKPDIFVHKKSNNKNEIVAHPTGHGNAHFGPTQQPANNPVALV
jgi:hypothetical protein